MAEIFDIANLYHNDFKNLLNEAITFFSTVEFCEIPLNRRQLRFDTLYSLL